MVSAAEGQTVVGRGARPCRGGATGERLERYTDPAPLTLAAHRAVADTAAASRKEAPHLADLLTKAPPNGTPLLAVAFGFFFRREVETNSEIAHGLTFAFLRQISDRQERGFLELEASLWASRRPRPRQTGRLVRRPGRLVGQPGPERGGHPCSAGSVRRNDAPAAGFSRP